MSGYTLIIRAQPEADRDVALLRRYRVPAIASPIIKSHALVNDIPELKAFLESKKQDIDIRGRNGWTALHTATFCDRKEAFEVLLQQGASVLPDDMGKTPLHIVSQRGDLRMMMSIFQIVSIRKSDMIESEGKTMIPWWSNPMSERDNIVFDGVE